MIETQTLNPDLNLEEEKLNKNMLRIQKLISDLQKSTNTIGGIKFKISTIMETFLLSFQYCALFTETILTIIRVEEDNESEVINYIEEMIESLNEVEVCSHDKICSISPIVDMLILL